LRILVIKHGALGDIVLAFPAFAAIRRAHAQAEITLLTTAPFTQLLGQSAWFDRIEVDFRLPFWNLPALLRLIRQLRGYDMVYDLQTSRRSSGYFRLAGRPPWSGIAKGCAFAHVNPARVTMHTRERIGEQLAIAGISNLAAPNLSWLTGSDVTRFCLPERFALLVAGASAPRPEKKWPPAHFRELAKQLDRQIVWVGGSGEQLPFAVPGLNLIGQTSLAELAAITARASLAIGNDTGPMHLAAALNIPSVVLFSGASDPALTAPRYPDGGWPIVLRAPSLADLPVAMVLSSLQ
jgi:ADP-heptose:LPS heptosyltransferase